MKRILLAAGVLCCIMLSPGFATMADSCRGFTTKMSDNTTMYFRLYVPKNFSTQYRYPLVMCLHGIGECGTDNQKQVNNEYMSHQWMLDSIKTKYKAFVLYPQCPSSSFEFGYFNTGTAAQKGTAALPSQAAVKVIDSLIKVYPIDTTRLYVGGLSWGGIGTQGIMTSYPDKFAAAFPCAGENFLNKDSVPLSRVTVMTKTPFWIWHGLSDGTVTVKPDTLLVTGVIKAGIPVVKFVTLWTLSSFTFTPQGAVTTDSLNKTIVAGAKYLCTTIPSGNHNSGWQTCFYHPFLVPWLMSKSRVNGQTVFTWPAPGPASVVTAVNNSSRPSFTGKSLSAGRGIIRWNGVTGLPARIALFSARGALLKHYSIGSSRGELACSGMPAGVYIAVLQTQRSPAEVARMTMTIDK